MTIEVLYEKDNESYGRLCEHMEKYYVLEIGSEVVVKVTLNDGSNNYKYTIQHDQVYSDEIAPLVYAKDKNDDFMLTFGEDMTLSTVEFSLRGQ